MLSIKVENIDLFAVNLLHGNSFFVGLMKGRTAENMPTSNNISNIVEDINVSRTQNWA
jgi:hypothetical protein